MTSVFSKQEEKNPSCFLKLPRALSCETLHSASFLTPHPHFLLVTTLWPALFVRSPCYEYDQCRELDWYTLARTLFSVKLAVTRQTQHIVSHRSATLEGIVPCCILWTLCGVTMLALARATAEHYARMAVLPRRFKKLKDPRSRWTSSSNSTLSSNCTSSSLLRWDNFKP